MKKLTLVALLAAAWFSPASYADDKVNVRLTEEQVGALLPATTIVRVGKDGSVAMFETKVAIEATTAQDAEAALAMAEQMGAFKSVTAAANSKDPANEFNGGKGSAASWYYYLGYWGGSPYNVNIYNNYYQNNNYYPYAPYYNYGGYGYNYSSYNNNSWYNYSYGYGYNNCNYYWWANPYNNRYWY